MAADLPPARDPSQQDTLPIRPSAPRHDTWTSPLWGHPDTVGGYWRAQPTAPPDLERAPQEPPPSSPRRGFVVVGVIAVVLAVLVGSVGILAFLRPDGDDKAVAPLPSASLAPTNPASPPSPSAPSNPQPSPQTGQPPGSGGQNSALSAD